MNTETVKQRLNALRLVMKEEGIDCYLVFTSDYHQSEYVDAYFKTREFLSGFTGSAGYMAITQEEAILWADGRYHVQALAQIQGTGITLFKQGLEGVETLPEYLKRTMKAGMCVACDGKTISRKYYEELLEAAGDASFLTNPDLFEKIWQERPAMTANPVYELPLSVSGLARNVKLSQIRKKLRDLGADSFVLSELSAIMWLFNIRGSDVAYNPVAFSHAYVSDHDAVLFLQNGTCDEALRSSLAEDNCMVLPYEGVLDYYSGISSLTLVLDPSQVNVEIYALLDKSNTIVDLPNDEMISKCIKNETEIALAKHYHVEDGVAMVRFIRRIKDAVGRGETLNECEAAAIIDDLRRKNRDFKDLSFETICAYRENGAIIHYAPKEGECKTLGPKGFLLLDSGAQYPGATTDVTRTIALGPLTDEEKRDYTAVLRSMIALAQAVFLKGTTGANLDILARGPVWELGIDYRHGTGHGIGAFLNVHEGPQNFRYKTTDGTEPVPIEPGMLISDEPGIYIEGSHGIRIENEILCVPKMTTEWGEFYAFETLTLVPLEREAILPSMLNEKETAWINDYHRRVLETLSPFLEEEERLWLDRATAPL